MDHILYKTGDIDVPEQICDQNGEVVLSLCKICGHAEVELNSYCPGDLAQMIIIEMIDHTITLFKNMGKHSSPPYAYTYGWKTSINPRLHYLRNACLFCENFHQFGKTREHRLDCPECPFMVVLGCTCLDAGYADMSKLIDIPKLLHNLQIVRAYYVEKRNK